MQTAAFPYGGDVLECEMLGRWWWERHMLAGVFMKKLHDRWRQIPVIRIVRAAMHVQTAKFEFPDIVFVRFVVVLYPFWVILIFIRSNIRVE